MIRALKHYVDRFVEATGGWSILALDGILLIPLLFAVFFFPVRILIGVGAAIVLTAGTLAVRRARHAHQHRHGIM
jgi:hypothetical protein